MKKSIISLLLCCALLMTVLAPSLAFAEDLSFTDYDELLAYLQAQSNDPPSRIEFVCSSQLYKTLSDNDFTELYRLLLKAGIDVQKSYFYYSDSSAAIRVNYPEYIYYPWADVSTTEELEYAIRELSTNADDEAQDFVLVYSDELARELGDRGRLDYYAARCGVDSIYARPLSERVVKISSVQFFDKPYAQVDDYAQFAAAVSGFADQGVTDFYIVFSPELFARISDSSEENKVMESGSKLFSYGAGIYQDKCTIHYYGAEYTDLARAVCRSAEDVKETIREMGAAGISDFELIFANRSVYDELAENDFARLNAIEREAGMIGADMSYGGGRIIYENAEITAEVVALESLADAVAYTESLVQAGSTDIHLFCTEDLYESILGDLAAKGIVFFPSGSNRIYDLLSQAGINDYDLSVSEAIHVINIHVNSLFPGTAIMQAVRNGDSSALTAREKETWDAAAKIAEQAKSNDPLLTAKGIHDWLCEHVVYTNDETTEEDDNAIGAILNGEANCDGYTDAFYLIGSLAGLNIRYQHGDSYNKGLMQFSTIPVTHIWNLLEIDGVWHMVDVTWDDDEDGCTYIWFNVGNDIAKRMHKWNEDMTVELADTTERVYSGSGDFYIRSRQDLENAVKTAEERKLQTLQILFEDLSLSDIVEEAKDMVADASGAGILSYFWEERMGLLGFHELTWK